MRRQRKSLRHPRETNLHLTFNQESYFKQGFIATGDSHAPSLLGDRLSNEVMKPSKLLSPLGDQAPCINRQAFGVF